MAAAVSAKSYFWATRMQILTRKGACGKARLAARRVVAGSGVRRLADLPPAPPGQRVAATAVRVPAGGKAVEPLDGFCQWCCGIEAVQPGIPPTSGRRAEQDGCDPGEEAEDGGGTGSRERLVGRRCLGHTGCCMAGCALPERSSTPPMAPLGWPRHSRALVGHSTERCVPPLLAGCVAGGRRQM